MRSSGRDATASAVFLSSGVNVELAGIADIVSTFRKMSAKPDHVRAALRATKVPVLHMVGSLDTNLAASRHLKENVLPSVEFMIIPNATQSETIRQNEFVERLGIRTDSLRRWCARPSGMPASVPA